MALPDDAVGVARLRRSADGELRPPVRGGGGGGGEEAAAAGEAGGGGEGGEA